MITVIKEVWKTRDKSRVYHTWWVTTVKLFGVPVFRYWRET